tara:strand:+ start:2171 stop:3439 length:1269 start_codon:yes stop_codon:yes gene_type:complete
VLKELAMNDKMQECTVCGLAFLSGDFCPGCGSNIHQKIISEENEEQLKDDLIPGMKEFLETSVGVIPDSKPEENEIEKPSSTLPFGMGGDSVSMKSTLPFGVGSHSMFFKSSNIEISLEEGTQDLPKEESSIELKHSVLELESSIEDEMESEVKKPEYKFSDEEPQQLSNYSIQNQETEPDSAFTDELESNKIDSDIIIHDFSEEELTTEIHVDLDNLVDYNSTDSLFNPMQMEAAAEPELHPLKALAVDGLSDHDLISAVNEGFLAMGSENWELASYKFHQVARTGQGGAAALNNYGLALLQKAIQVFESGDGTEKALVDSQFEAAIFALRQAAQIEGQRSEILYNLAVALHRTAFYEKSLIVFDALIERDGHSAYVLNGKAVLLESKGDFEGAKKLLTQAIDDSPDDEIIKSNLSRLVLM